MDPADIQHLTDTGHVLDPRMISIQSEANADARVGFVLQPVWQDAVSSTSGDFVDGFFAVQAAIV